VWAWGLGYCSISSSSFSPYRPLEIYPILREIRNNCKGWRFTNGANLCTLSGATTGFSQCPCPAPAGRLPGHYKAGSLFKEQVPVGRGASGAMGVAFSVLDIFIVPPFSGCQPRIWVLCGTFGYYLATGLGTY
jgi:hypothetical protein